MYQILINIHHVTLILYHEVFQKACKQTVMLNKFVLLISKAHSYEELFLKRDQQILKQKCRNWQQNIVCDFNSRNRVLGRKHQIQKINKVLGGLDVRGKINIQKPQKRYTLIEDHIWYQQHHESAVDSTLKQIYFGIQLCSNRKGTAKFNSKYELSKRIYLGPTSADNDLAFMMCNQGKISEGSFVIDPFVGTGGLIIPPASKGAYVFGCDLDMRVINGYSVGRINKRSPFYKNDEKFEIYTPKINLNFQQYGFQIPNIFRMDSTKLGFKKQQFFDAIITDPPYGLRAMSRSIGSNKIDICNQQQQQIQKKQEYIPKNNQQQKIVQIKTDDLIHLQDNEQTPNSTEIQKNQPQDLNDHQEKIEESQIQQTQIDQSKESSLQEQILKKQQRKKLKKLNKINKKKQMTQDEIQFKKTITEKLNRQRIDHWDKFDKTKVECTQRQKIFERLINFARTNLKEGGRLVFLYPIYENEEYKRELSMPEHKGFQLIDLSENKLSKNNSRILVTLQKKSKESKN